MANKWLQLFLNVVDYELRDGPLLSEDADRLVERSPLWGRVFILSVGAVVTLHVANCVPERFDLLARSFWRAVLRGDGR